MRRYIDFAEQFKETKGIPRLSSLIDNTTMRTKKEIGYLSNIEYSVDKDLNSPREQSENISSSFPTSQAKLSSPFRKKHVRKSNNKSMTIPNISEFNPRKSPLRIHKEGFSTSNKKAISFNISLSSLPNISSPQRKTFREKKKKTNPISLFSLTPSTRMNQVVGGSPIRGIIETKCDNILQNCKTEIKDINIYNDKKIKEQSRMKAKANKEKFEKKNLISLVNFKRDMKELDDRKKEDFQTLPVVEIFARSNELIQKSGYVSKINSNFAYNAKNVLTDIFEVNKDDDIQRVPIRDDKIIKQSRKKISQLENLMDKNVTANNRCKLYLKKVNKK